jgi:hypothetical protein
MNGQINSSFLTIRAGRINSITTNGGDVRVEFEDVDNETLLKTVMDNVTPSTFVSGYGDYEVADVYKYVCKMKRHLELYEPSTIGLEPPSLYDFIFEMSEEDQQELTNYLFERYAVGEHA